MFDEFNILKVNYYTNSLLGCHQPCMNNSGKHSKYQKISFWATERRSTLVFLYCCLFFFPFDSRPFRRPRFSFIPTTPGETNKMWRTKPWSNSSTAEASAARRPGREARVSHWWAALGEWKIAAIAWGKPTGWNSPNWFWAQQQVWVWKWPRESLSHFKGGGWEDAGRKHIKQHERLSKPSYLSEHLAGFLMLSGVYPTRLHTTP